MRFVGAISATPATLELSTADGVVQGVIDVGGYRYSIAGQHTAGQIEGVLTDTFTGEQLPAAASIDESTGTIVAPPQARFDLALAAVCAVSGGRPDHADAVLGQRR